MLNRRHIFKAATAALTAVFIASSAPAFAGTGRVRLGMANAGFIVGIGGGSGTLTFQGHTYPLRIGGLNIGVIGASGGTLVGTARNLNTATDIVGTYTAVGAGIAVGGRRPRHAHAELQRRHSRTAGHAGGLRGQRRPERLQPVHVIGPTGLRYRAAFAERRPFYWTSFSVSAFGA